MQTQVKQWGNSQGIRIPKEVLMAANISLDEVLDITVSEGVIVLEKPFRHITLEERAAAFGGRLEQEGEEDWVKPVGREKW